jgi:exopolysaccharide biosynthesis polyprenyl glycosylphosphotransferase
MRRQRLFAGLSGPRLTVSERKLLLAAVDVLVVNGALLGAMALRLPETLSYPLLTLAIYLGLLTVMWAIWASFFDCYDLPLAADASRSIWSTGRAALLVAVSYLLIPRYTPYFTSSRLSAAVFVGLVVVSVPAWRALYAVVFSQPSFQRRFLIVGAGRSGSELVRELVGVPQFGNLYAGSGCQVVGFVDDDPKKAGATVDGLPVLGDRHDLRRLVEEYDVDVVVVAITHTPQIHPELFQVLLDCQEQGVRLEPMTSVYERLTGKVPVEHSGRDLYVIMPLSDSATQRLFMVGKRLLDLFAALVGLVILLPVSACVALADAVWCRGSVFYWQTRVGKGGRSFRLVKFRTMIPTAEDGSGAVWARKDDPRVTPVGQLLRKTRLDELPQAWNILKGEMSLVGPRPERPEFVNELAKQVPFYQARHAVRPGITGWAQVRYDYGSTVHDALVKLQHDLYYIKHQGPYLELSIMVKTARVMFGMRGR